MGFHKRTGPPPLGRNKGSFLSDEDLVMCPKEWEEFGQVAMSCGETASQRRGEENIPGGGSQVWCERRDARVCSGISQGHGKAGVGIRDADRGK